MKRWITTLCACAQAVEQTGTTDVDAVRQAVGG
jgi:hypothetical protein